MGTPKVDKAKLKELHDQGVTAAQIARQFGVSKAAISKALKAMGKAVNSHVAIEKAKKVVDRKMVTIEQLQKINDYANELLDLVMRWNRGDDVALQILENQVRKIKIGKGVRSPGPWEVVDYSVLYIPAIGVLKPNIVFFVPENNNSIPNRSFPDLISLIPHGHSSRHSYHPFFAATFSLIT